MSQENIVLGVADITAKVTFDPIVGNWQAGRPVTNLQSFPLSNVARSVEPSYVSTKIGWNCEADELAGLFGVVRHKGMQDALVKFILYSENDYDGVTVLDTGWMDLLPIVYDLYDDEFARDQFLSGKYSDAQLAGKVRNRVHWAGQNIVHKSGLCLIHDPNNPDGYFEAGMLKIEQGMQFSTNFRYGSQRGSRNRDEKVEARGGAVYSERHPTKRVFKGEIPYLTESQAEILDEMKESYGTATPFLFVESPSDPRRTRGWLARFTDTELHTLAAYKRNTCPISIEEVIEQ